MATDINATIEYFLRPPSWSSFTGGGIHLYGDYVLFGALAGVRRDAGKSPLFAPRGLPEHITFDTAKLLDWRLMSQGQEVERGYERVQQIGGHWLLVGPESSAHSWLTLPEIHDALRHYGAPLQERQVEFRAVMAAMEQLGAACGGDRVRLVFWFDH
jgi:hypothetical protein